MNSLVTEIEPWLNEQPTEALTRVRKYTVGPGDDWPFELRISGWGDAPGAPTLGTYAAALDHSGLLGANAVPSNPGVDLLTIDEPPYGTLTGVYIVLKTCHTFAGVNTGLEIWDKVAWEEEKRISQEQAWQIIESLENT